MTDSISDMLIRIKNAFLVKNLVLEIPASKIKSEIATILLKEGYIKDFKKVKRGGHKFLRIHLQYNEDGSSAITEIKRVSKPGQRIYVKSTEIPYIRSGFGFSIISTSKGLLVGKEARQQKVGGEIICKVW